MKKNQICSHCILDSHDDPHITFDKDGVCNHCHIYKENLKKYYFGDDPELKKFNDINFD